jgi:hypothetical protein
MPFLYTSCVLDCALRSLMIFLLLIKKKIGVVCVRRMGNLWIIFFCIVRLLLLYGIPSSIMLGCLGSCLDK